VIGSGSGWVMQVARNAPAARKVRGISGGAVKEMMLEGQFAASVRLEEEVSENLVRWEA
jgi:ATP sulfurylase